ncbi:MAG: M23 family metallopeptidase [Patescibacteria group bacterium]
MKYKLLLKILYLLVGIKKFLWWSGKNIYLHIAKFFVFIWRFFAFWNYKLEYFLKKIGLGTDKIWWLKRSNLQIILLVVLFVSALPQTKILSQELGVHPGQKTMAYKLFGPGESYDYEEISAEATTAQTTEAPAWKSGVVQSEPTLGAVTEENNLNIELGTFALSGAVGKPVIMSGAAIVNVSRKEVMDYTIQPGDSLSSIAYRYGVSISTLMWENGISYTTLLRPGDKLHIPPTTGVMHTIKKGDTLKKIASTYGAKAEDIVIFNGLSEDGTDLVIGKRIMIPNGTAVQVAVRPKSTYTTSQGKYTGTVPASSGQSASVSGYVWPSAARTITQYYSWRHLGLDLASKLNTPNYAARAGTVTKSQCGWNSGYGCVIIIDHGNGVITLYGHNNKLLVSVGDYVKAGQTIGLMGNTGNVRGVTGIHLHFEVRVNGARVNPLKYVK